MTGVKNLHSPPTRRLYVLCSSPFNFARILSKSIIALTDLFWFSSNVPKLCYKVPVLHYIPSSSVCGLQRSIDCHFFGLWYYMASTLFRDIRYNCPQGPVCHSLCFVPSHSKLYNKVYRLCILTLSTPKSALASMIPIPLSSIKCFLLYQVLFHKCLL